MPKVQGDPPFALEVSQSTTLHRLVMPILHWMDNETLNEVTINHPAPLSDAHYLRLRGIAMADVTINHPAPLSDAPLLPTAIAIQLTFTINHPAPLSDAPAPAQR